MQENLTPRNLMGRCQDFDRIKLASAQKDGWISALLRKIILDNFKKMTRGSLTIVLPDRSQLFIGESRSAVNAQICILRNDFFRKCVFFGAIGFAESYID